MEVKVTKLIKNVLPKGWRRAPNIAHRVLVDKTNKMKHDFLIEREGLKEWAAIYIEKDVWAYGDTPKEAMDNLIDMDLNPEGRATSSHRVVARFNEAAVGIGLEEFEVRIGKREI